MLDCKPIVTLAEVHTKLCSNGGKDLEGTTMYRQLIGILIYLTLMRPDISYVVVFVSRYMQNLNKPYQEAIKRILQYIRGNIDFGILYKKERPS